MSAENKRYKEETNVTFRAEKYGSLKKFSGCDQWHNRDDRGKIQ